jgi:hypothetical protein
MRQTTYYHYLAAYRWGTGGPLSTKQLPSGETNDKLHVSQNSVLYCSSNVSMPYCSLIFFPKYYCKGRIRIGDITRIIRLKSKDALLIRKTYLFYPRLYVQYRCMFSLRSLQPDIFFPYFATGVNFVIALFFRTLCDHNGVFQVDKSLGGFAVNDQFEAGFPDGIIFF